MRTSVKQLRDGKQVISATPRQVQDVSRTLSMSAKEETYVNRRIRSLMDSGVVLDFPRMQSEIQKARKAFSSIQAAKQVWAGYCGPSCTPNTPLYRKGRRA
jgi:hypothetical protein